MFRASVNLFVPLLLVSALAAQSEEGCGGPTFSQFFTDIGGRDVRLTSVQRYPGTPGDFLVGGMVGSDLVLMRLDALGALRWSRAIPIATESTELTNINDLIVDDRGLIAGVGTTFRDNQMRGFVFRYDPRTDLVLYFTETEEPSEWNTIVQRNGAYLLLGARIALPQPLFAQAMTQRVSLETGIPTQPAELYDLGGEERFTNVTSLPDGRLLVAGNMAYSGGAGSNRAALTFLDADDRATKTLLGPVSQSSNSRLFAFDVKVLGDRIYLLSWGDIGVIQGGLSTSPLLSCFTLGGEHLWTNLYEIANYLGEQAISMQVQDEDLLLYGYSLIGRRQVFLTKIDPAGTHRWSRGIDSDGITLLYYRAGQNMMTDANGISLVTSYKYGDGRPQQGALIRLDRNAGTLNECTRIDELTVATTPQATDWREVFPTITTLDFPWQSYTNVRPEADRLAAFDDCDNPCDACDVTTFIPLVICRGDSTFLDGAWRSETGIYTDTLAAANGCDSLVSRELNIVEPLSAEITQNRGCGNGGAVVGLTTRGGLPPYTYHWPSDTLDGNRSNFLPAGDYTVTVSDFGGCGTAEIDLTVDRSPRETYRLETKAPDCGIDSSGIIRFADNKPGRLRLTSDSAFLESARTGLPPGSYNVIMIGSTGCEVFRQMTVPEGPQLRVRIEAAGPLRPGQELPLLANIRHNRPLASVDWSAPARGDCPTCPEALLRAGADTMVHVRVTDAAGCVAEDSLSLRLVDFVSDVYVPNAFSPNGDGTNDEFRAFPGFIVDRIDALVIYDRWGNQVFSGTADEGWNGGDSPPGVYLYLVDYTKRDGTTVRRRGELMLLR